MNFNITDNEYWWGGRVHDGVCMPIDRESVYTADLSESTPNHSSPLFVSSRGRYIWSDEPFKIEVNKGIVNVTGNNVRLFEGFENLKGACMAAAKNHFKFGGKIPAAEFFEKPQYNTWIALNHNQTQKGVLDYAKEIIRLGFTPGVLMIDSCWERWFGELEFDGSRFENPSAMTEALHNMGFKIMLWVSPCVSPDSFTFRKIRNSDILLKDVSGEIAVRSWWDGYSAVLDLTNPNARKYFEDKLNGLMDKYGIDGFKFDAGDFYFYRDDDKSYTGASAQEQAQAFAEFAERFSFNELRVSWKNGGEALVMRLSDKMHSWDGYGLNMVMPNTFVCGMLGYPYCCPDMIGGGEYMQFNECADSLDAELFVRYAQASALMPMMQFSALPSCPKDETAVLYIRKAAKLHEKMSGYILETAKNSAKTGEPVMRHMAYEFPNEGFEKVNDQFMLGEKILVAPVVVKGQRKRKVKLPKGKWRYCPKGTDTDGGTTIEADAPLGVLPYFERI